MMIGLSGFMYQTILNTCFFSEGLSEVQNSDKNYSTNKKFNTKTVHRRETSTLDLTHSSEIYFHSYCREVSLPNLALNVLMTCGNVGSNPTYGYHSEWYVSKILPVVCWQYSIIPG